MNRTADSPGTAYSALLWRRKWLIVGTFLVTLFVVTLGTALLTPVYQATATLRVLTAARGSVDWVDYDIAYTERLMNTYAQLATSEPVLQEVSQHLDNRPLPAISAQVVANTELMTLVAEGQDPALLADAVNTLASVIISRSGDLYASQDGSASQILADDLARAEADLLQAQSDYASALAETPNNAARLRALSSSIDVKRETYTSLLSQYERAQVADRMRGSVLSIVQMAAVPSVPTKPNLLMNLVLGGLVGLVGGLGLAVLFQNLDRRLYSEEEVQAATGLPVLAAIADGSRWWSLLLDGDRSRPEIYHRLRTSLGAVLEEGAKTLLITSAQPREGKSTLAINLAIVLGQTGRRVALVEANLHQPALHGALELRNEAGLTTVLAGKRALKDVVQATPYPGVWVLTSGPLPATPVELFSSPAMGQVLEALEAQFDVVLLDGPSILGVSDASVLATLVDGIVLVVSLAEATKGSIQAACRELARLEFGPSRATNLLGVVVNQVKSTGDERFQRYYRRSANPPVASPGGGASGQRPAHSTAGREQASVPSPAVTPRTRSATLVRPGDDNQHGSASR